MHSKIMITLTCADPEGCMHARRLNREGKQRLVEEAKNALVTTKCPVCRNTLVPHWVEPALNLIKMQSPIPGLEYFATLTPLERERWQTRLHANPEAARAELHEILVDRALEQGKHAKLAKGAPKPFNGGFF